MTDKELKDAMEANENNLEDFEEVNDEGLTPEQEEEVNVNNELLEDADLDNSVSTETVENSETPTVGVMSEKTEEKAEPTEDKPEEVKSTDVKSETSKKKKHGKAWLGIIATAIICGVGGYAYGHYQGDQGIANYDGDRYTSSELYRDGQTAMYRNANTTQIIAQKAVVKSINKLSHVSNKKVTTYFNELADNWIKQQKASGNKKATRKQYMQAIVSAGYATSKANYMKLIKQSLGQQQLLAKYSGVSEEKVSTLSAKKAQKAYRKMFADANVTFETEALENNVLLVLAQSN